MMIGCVPTWKNMNLVHYASVYCVLYFTIAVLRNKCSLTFFTPPTHLLYFSQRNWFWTLNICKILYLNSGTVL